MCSFPSIKTINYLFRRLSFFFATCSSLASTRACPAAAALRDCRVGSSGGGTVRLASAAVSAGLPVSAGLSISLGGACSGGSQGLRLADPNHMGTGRGVLCGLLEEAPPYIRPQFGDLRFCGLRPVRGGWGLTVVEPLKGSVLSRSQFPLPCSTASPSSSQLTSSSSDKQSPTSSAAGEILLGRSGCGTSGLPVGCCFAWQPARFCLMDCLS